MAHAVALLRWPRPTSFIADCSSRVVVNCLEDWTRRCRKDAASARLYEPPGSGVGLSTVRLDDAEWNVDGDCGRVAMDCQDVGDRSHKSRPREPAIVEYHSKPRSTGRVHADNPQGAASVSRRRIASSRAFLTLSRSLLCERPAVIE